MPKAFWIDPLICSNFRISVSENDRMSTKNAISSVAMSAKVAIQAGAPLLQGGHSSEEASSEEASELASSDEPPASDSAS